MTDSGADVVTQLAKAGEDARNQATLIVQEYNVSLKTFARNLDVKKAEKIRQELKDAF